MNSQDEGKATHRTAPSPPTTRGLKSSSSSSSSILPLRQYEEAVAALLLLHHNNDAEQGRRNIERIQPMYHQLPPAPNTMVCSSNRSNLHLAMLWALYFGDDPPLGEATSTIGDSETTTIENNFSIGSNIRCPTFVSAARVFGTLSGQLSDPIRAQRKEDQIRSMLRCIAMCLSESQSTSTEMPSNRPGAETTTNNSRTTTTIVDFGGGSGHLAIPLALLFPHCHVLVIDLSSRSLQLLHEKAKVCALELPSHATSASKTPPSFTNMTRIQHTAIPNLYTYCGPIQAVQNDSSIELQFDLGVALHLCGEATDVAMRYCIQLYASMVLAPCCVGKLNVNRFNPHVYQATGSNTPTIQYPQSQLYQSIFLHNNQTAAGDNTSSTSSRCCDIHDRWNALAKAADYSDVLEYGTRRNSTRRMAKTLLEWDRCLYLREHGQEQSPARESPHQPTPANLSSADHSSNNSCNNVGVSYPTVLLTRMEPWECSPKNDIIVAISRGKSAQPTSLLQGMSLDTTAMADWYWTHDHVSKLLPGNHHYNSKAAVDHDQAGRGLEDAFQNGTSPRTVAEPPTTVRSSSDSLERSRGRPSCALGKNADNQQVDWTNEEENDIERILRNYFGIQDNADAGEADHTNAAPLSVLPPQLCQEQCLVYYFPIHMGRRKRKLVHHVANRLQLDHWSHGRYHGGRTVAVALPGMRQQLQHQKQQRESIER